MTRRSFLASLFAAPLAAHAVWANKATAPIILNGPIAYRGIPFIYDATCPPNRIYFLHDGKAYFSTPHVIEWWQTLGQ